MKRLAALALCLTLGFCATIDHEPIHVLTSDGFNLPTAVAFPF